MMRHIPLPCLLLFLLAVPGHAQTDGIRFTPKWKVGDVRTASIERHEREVDHGITTKDTTYTEETQYRVTTEDDVSVTLEVRYGNVTMQMAAVLHDHIDEELKEYQNMALKYRVDKATGEAELVNWEEVSAFMTKVVQAIQKTVSEDVAFRETILAPVLNTFKDRKNMEAFMAKEIHHLLLPFGKAFVPGDTLRIHGSEANPFNPADTVEQTTLAWIVDTDGRGTGTCEIHSKVLLDLDAFKKMVASLMRSMGADDDMEQKSQEIMAAFEFDVSNSTVITLDETTTWPLTVVQETLVTGSELTGTTEKSVRATIRLR